MKTRLELNIAEFLAEYFLDITGAEDEFSYGLFWDSVLKVTRVYSVVLLTP